MGRYAGGIKFKYVLLPVWGDFSKLVVPLMMEHEVVLPKIGTLLQFGMAGTVMRARCEVCVCVCACVCIYICMYICKYMNILHTHTNTHTHTHTHFMYVYAYVCVCVCVSLCLCLCTYTHTHTHTYTYRG